MTDVASTAFSVLSPGPDIEPRYLFRWMTSDYLVTSLLPLQRGSQPPAVLDEDVRAQLIVVPPLEAQRRIVARIDELFAEIDDGEAALARARDDLARWRKALLKAAVTGELTADWRAASSTLESGGDLVTKIVAEGPSRRKKAAKSTDEVLPHEDESLPPLPNTWAWTTLEEIASAEASAISDGPFGSNLKSSHYVAQGPRVLRLQNIGRDGSFIDASAHIEEDHFNTLSRHHVRAGDLVIAILGEPVPRAIIVPASVGPALVKADCIKVRLDDRISVEFVWAWLNSIVVHSRFEHAVKGVGRPRLSMSHVRRMAVPIPPSEEQVRIVERVQTGLQSLVEAHQAIEDQEAAASTLRQSILAAAFRGELA